MRSSANSTVSEGATVASCTVIISSTRMAILALSMGPDAARATARRPAGSRGAPAEPARSAPEGVGGDPEHEARAAQEQHRRPDTAEGALQPWHLIRAGEHTSRPEAPRREAEDDQR